MEPLPLSARLWLAFILPWQVLFDGRLAALIKGAQERAALPPEPEIPEAPEVEPERDLSPALQLLSILQRDGRFVDFLQEDVSGFSDADIGAAARVVHDGCNKALTEYIAVAPIRTENEGDAVTLEAGFDPAKTRLTGNVVGEPPFSGKLAHHGWRATRIELPDLAEGKDPTILAPAEVEL